MATCSMVNFAQQLFSENQICSTFRMEFYKFVYSCICRIELLGFGVIQFYSATFLFFMLKIAALIVLNHNSSLERRHFTCSWDNLFQKRYWALVSSSLAHADINHLLCNNSELAANGALFESFVGLRVSLLFFSLASTVSGLISLKVHVGASGVTYAIDGYLVRLVDFDWGLVFVDYVYVYCR